VAVELVGVVVQFDVKSALIYNQIAHVQLCHCAWLATDMDMGPSQSWTWIGSNPSMDWIGLDWIGWDDCAPFLVSNHCRTVDDVFFSNCDV